MINKLQLLFFLLFVLLHSHVSGQETVDTKNLVIKATIIDQKTSEVIPYATIFNKTKGHGTYSNLEGQFSLNNIALNDTLTISFVGYQKKTMVVSESILQKVIYLSSNPEVLDVVNIYGDKYFLYDLVARCTKTQSFKNKTAKTYYSLRSNVDDLQVELVESYYNGQFTGYDISSLNLKNGRIALSDFRNRFFVSTESSKAIYMHKLFDENQYFPTSPFELNKRKLKKTYDLTLNSKYLDDKSNIVYVIDFSPKDESNRVFKGKVWIESSRARIIKVDLQIEKSKVHPFIPHGDIDSLIQVDLNISKTFSNIDNKQYVNSVDFDYQLIYKTSERSQFNVNTNAVIFAYDYDSAFVLPKFHFSNRSHEDYQKISAFPYNQHFWDNIDEFGMNDLTNGNNLFLKEKSKVTSESLFRNDNQFGEGFLKHPYYFWSRNRIKLKQITNDKIDFENMIPSQLYNLHAQIYLDLNKFNDSIQITTATVFDPFESYYYYPLTDEGIAFINMYFDLVEAHRLDLEQALKSETNFEQMMIRYNEKIEHLKWVSLKFFKEVDHGNNKKGMLNWNAFIRDKIGIDNVGYFNLYNEE